MRERELCSLLFGLADPSGFHPVKLMPGAPRGPFEIPRDLRVIPRDPLSVRPQANRIIFVTLPPSPLIFLCFLLEVLSLSLKESLRSPHLRLSSGGYIFSGPCSFGPFLLLLSDRWAYRQPVSTSRALS